MFPEKELAQLVISACVNFNIDTVVVSPGSRNAPLTIGFSNHPKIEALSVVDERCAAFFALGIAQQKQKPVAIVCTSGSALLNYYPAIAEAFYSKIPLVVISADRPKHLVDVGDGQTIRQENVFDNHILFSANLVESKESFIQNKEKLTEAFTYAIKNKGPVHINVPFDEPLYETVEELNNFDFLNKDILSVDDKEIDYLYYSNIWKQSKRKLILVGVNNPDEELQSVLDTLVDDASVLVFTETTSNLYHNKYVNSIDQLIFSLDEVDFTNLQPDVLVTFGGMLVSKRVKKFLRAYKPKHHWHVDPIKSIDTFFSLTSYVKLNPSMFFKELSILNTESTYQIDWLSMRDIKKVKHASFLQTAEYSDLKVVGSVLSSLPKDVCLQISNSAVIRYAQLYNIDKTIKVYCNRGTSGIDGSTSTAIGAAYKNRHQTVLVTGDLSFFYDSNALWNTNIKNNFRIIVINNSGGGIFKIIPGPGSTNASRYFETPHNLTAEYLCKMYDLDYVKANSEVELKEKLSGFYKDSDKPKLLEIFTPSNKNNKVLKDYFKNLK